MGSKIEGERRVVVKKVTITGVPYLGEKVVDTAVCEGLLPSPRTLTPNQRRTLREQNRIGPRIGKG